MNEQFFYNHPIFRIDEFRLWKNSVSKANLNNVKNELSYYKKIGRLLKIKRGLYAVLPPTEITKNYPIDPYLIAAKATNDGLLAYHTALELHGIAHSAFNQFTFVSNQKMRSFEFQGQWFKSTQLSKQVNEQGIEQIKRQGVVISITNMARTFVDVIDRIELSGGLEEVVRSINKIAVLNAKEVVRYCLLHKNHRLAAKVGFFLEQRKGFLAVNDSVVKPLLDFKPLAPQYIYNKKAPSSYIKKWNLIVPRSLLEQSWEEPDHDI